MPTNPTTLAKPSGQTILIVEDEFAVANNLRLILEKAGYAVSGIALSVAEALELNRQIRPDLVLLDIHLRGPQTGIDLAHLLTKDNIPFVYVSANTNASILEEVNTTEPYGFLVKPFREKDVLVALEIAHYRFSHRLEVRIRKEHELQIALTDVLSEEVEWEHRLLKTTRLFQTHIPFDYFIIGLKNQQEVSIYRSCSFWRIGKDEYQTIWLNNLVRMAGLTWEKTIQILEKHPYSEQTLYNGDEFEEVCSKNPLKQLLAKRYNLRSNLMMPLITAQNGTFFLSFYSRQSQAYKPEHLRLLERLRPSLTLTVDRLMAFDKINRLSEQLHQENTYLLEEVKTGANFEQIIGTSPLLLNVFKSIGQVAPTNCTVLVLGETGTGKELIARAVHNRSSRRSKPLIKVNCAALPPQLIESELFGHEKGSFTGAIEKRIGKFELAQGGTIFLDEIGELPLELQPKLLRVLQEKEIERIGGKGSFPCDVRIIAATNRHLRTEVAAGRFRSDLYYRLNVFPIQLPPLRERKEDLLPLSTFFLQKISKNLGKKLTGLSENAFSQMMAYHWPGNIRELEHLLERASIMTSSAVVSFVEPLVSDPNQLPASNTISQAPVVKQFNQAEKDNLLAALKLANYRIRGRGGAAELLNIKPTTLEGKMARLGIERRR